MILTRAKDPPRFLCCNSVLIMNGAIKITEVSRNVRSVSEYAIYSLDIASEIDPISVFDGEPAVEWRDDLTEPVTGWRARHKLFNHQAEWRQK